MSIFTYTSRPRFLDFGFYKNVIELTFTPTVNSETANPNFHEFYQILKFVKIDLYFRIGYWILCSGVDSEGAGGARAPPEFEGSQKWQSLISTYQSLAITTNTPGFEKLNTALL